MVPTRFLLRFGCVAFGGFLLVLGALTVALGQESAVPAEAADGGHSGELLYWQWLRSWSSPS